MSHRAEREQYTSRLTHYTPLPTTEERKYHPDDHHSLVMPAAELVILGGMRRRSMLHERWCVGLA